MNSPVIYTYAVGLVSDVEALLQERARLAQRVRQINLELGAAFAALAADQPEAVEALTGPLEALSAEITRRAEAPAPAARRLSAVPRRRPVKAIARTESIDADVIAAVRQGYRTKTEITGAVGWGQSAVADALQRLVADGRLDQRAARRACAS